MTPLLLALLLGPSAALADRIDLVSNESDPTVDNAVWLSYDVTIYGDSTAYIYAEGGRASCPVSAGAAAAGGMTLVDSTDYYYPTSAGPQSAWLTTSTPGEFLFCAYLHRDSDTSTARGTDSGSASVTLGTATASVGTFGGSATVRVPMTTAQRRELRARLVAGERVRAELDATSTADHGSVHLTSAATELALLAIGSFTPSVRVLSGA